MEIMGGRGSMSGMGGRNLSEIESRIRDNPTETAALIGTDGSILFDKSDGLAGQVSFTADEVSKMVDGTLTHNHPRGTTFSDDDIDLAMRAGLKEIRAVHENGYYSLTRQFNVGDSVPSKYIDFSRDYEKSVTSYMRNTVDAIYARTGDADRCNSMVADFRRQWLSGNSASYGWTYKEGRK